MSDPFFQPTNDAFQKGLEAGLAYGRPSELNGSDETRSSLDTETLQSFTTIANKYGVPADVLLSLAEKESGFDRLSRTSGIGPKKRGIIGVSDEDMAREKINPYEPNQAIDLAARKLRGYMDAGMTVEDAVKAHYAGPDRNAWGDDAEAYTRDVLGRTQRLAETYYPGMAPRVLETEGRPTVDQLRQAFDIAAPASDAPTMGENVSDATANLALGVNAAVRDMNELSKRILPEKVSQFIEASDKAIGGKTVEERGKEIEARLTAKLTPQMRESLQKKWWDSDKGEFGEAWKDWRSYAGPLLQSLPESIATSLPSLRLAKGVYGARIAAGATAAEAAASASTIATVAGAVSEGSLGGAQSARSVADEIKSIPIETLRKSEAFQSLLKSGMSEAAAREALAKDQSARAFITAGLATGAFGGMGDRVIAKTFLEAAGDTGVKALVKNLGKAAVGEGFLEEMPQSALQQAAENEAMQRADQGRSLSEGVANQALGGLATGALMGVGLGGGFRTATRDTAGAISAPEQPAPTRAESRAEGSVSTMPENAAPPALEPQTRDLPTKPEVPRGPLSRVLEVRAPHVSPLATAAGERVTLSDEWGQISGHVISQDAEGILFKGDDGLEQLISNSEIAGGLVAIAKASDMPAASPSPTAANAQAPIASIQPIVATEQPAPAPVAVSETSTAAPFSSAQRPVTETVTAPMTTAAVAPVSISQQATAAVREPAGATAPAYSGMTEPELRERLKSLAQQAKAAGGWNKMFVQERKKIETAIADLGNPSAQQTTTAPAQAPASAPSNPYSDPTSRTWTDEMSAEVILKRQGLAATHKVAPIEVTQGRGKNKATVTRYQIVPNVPTKLPANLAGAKPRYSYGGKQFTLNFANDFDRAAYIMAQAKPSKSDAAYLDFAMAASGMDEAAVRAHGAKVREAIKAQAVTAEPGAISVPAVQQATPATAAATPAPTIAPVSEPVQDSQPTAGRAPAAAAPGEKKPGRKRDAQRREQKKANAKKAEPARAAPDNEQLLSVAPATPERTASFTASDLSNAMERGKDGPLVKQMIQSGKIVLHNDETSLPGDGVKAGAVQGAMTPDGRIHLVAKNLTPETARAVLLHEAFHEGVEALVGTPAWRGLMVRVQNAINAAMEREISGKANAAQSFWKDALDHVSRVGTPTQHIAEEVAAYAIENREQAPAGLREALDRIIGAVKAWALRRFGAQFGEVTPAQLNALAVAALRSWDGKTNATMRGDIRYSIAAPAAAKRSAGKTLFQKATETASDYLTDLMVGKGTNDQFNILALTPVRPLFMELTQEMPAARNYLDSKQAMDAFRNQMNHEADTTLQSWISYAKKNEEENVDLMRIMHESTLKEVDPSKPFEATNDPEKDARRKLDHRALAKEFAALSPEAQKLYPKIRDAYKNRADAVEKQIIENVKNAINLIVKNAERRHADEMERIQDEGLQGKEREEAIKAADQALTMARTRDKRSKAARVKRMREYFELNRIKGPYFPLARFGNYFVTVRNNEGKVISFSKFESASEQRRFADDMRAAYGKKAVEVGAAARLTNEQRNIDPTFIANIDSILDDADIGMSVRDQIYQSYLETMPDLSMRKSRIHRKGTAGYNEDAIRAFASNMFHSAHQLARLKYGMELQDHLTEAQRQLRNGKNNTVRAQAVYNEMVRAHEFTMNPNSSSFSHHITSAVFLWTMAFNLSSAVINSLQTVTSGIPNLAYDQETKGGFNKSAKELARAVRDFMVGQGSVANASTLTDDEREAIKVGYDSGLIENTQSHDLAGLADSGIDYNPSRQAFMRAASLPMHHTERFNREITYLASYRVARDAGLSHQQAIRKASDLTWMTHFDNQANAKPRLMRSDVGKILFALKSYQANIVFRTFRDMHQSLHGADQETRTLAFKRLASTWALTAAVAGVPGAYFYGTLSTIAAAFLGMADSDDDPDEMLRKVVLETMGDSMIGRAIGGMIMDGVPGYITGTALTNRLGFGDLWLRSSDQDLSAEEAWTYWITQLGGASLGLTYQASRGLTDISKGNVERGLEKIVPSFIRNPMKAVRYAQEGVQDKSGNPIVDDVPIQDVLKQAIGFRPAEIADRYARNTYQTNLQNRIKTKAGDARKAVARAMLAGDQAAEEKAWKQVDAFNDRYPEYPIRPKSVMQSMRAMERRSDRMEFGVELDPKLAEKIKEGTSPSIYRR